MKGNRTTGQAKKEAGRLGGLANVKNNGIKYMAEIGRKGGLKKKKVVKEGEKDGTKI